MLERGQAAGGTPWRVVDLFSGAGGMSYGFHAHPSFRLVGAVDAQVGKPSSSSGLQCNATYFANMGTVPAEADLGTVGTESIARLLGLSGGAGADTDVLLACPPCTGFSRTNPHNHLRDDKRNSLVRRAAEFAVGLGARVVVLENARELIDGNFSHHYEWMKTYLQSHGYDVRGEVHLLSRFGLPQKRERAIVVAAKRGIPLRTLADLWEGHSVRPEAITVRRAFLGLDPVDELTKTYPRFGSREVLDRIRAIPHDGGSWIDLVNEPGKEHLLTGSMRRILDSGRIGSYPDVYGRMWWDRPAPTIKRECGHVGNGRYAHPTEDRLCSVREMAALQGFPRDYKFARSSVTNMYRHIGDAVPPLVSFQLAHLCSWMLSGLRPDPVAMVLRGTHLRPSDILSESTRVALNA